MKYRKVCYEEKSPQMQQIKLLNLKNNRAPHLSYGKFEVVSLKPMELPCQKSDLTDQGWACKFSSLIYVKHECNILFTIHCTNY